MDKVIRIRKLTKDIPKEVRLLCDSMLEELEHANRPVLGGGESVRLITHFTTRKRAI
jgi:hypothetical protein